ncbi:glycosyltransferase [Conservatibacter flavescens]|uniref:Glycosyltransferase 2-like domain-containing protein n=1 Tax=Conservatibacter flavescens TaxID=28161 RepID=A0A2M8S5E7_9PAST|nr:glycosyltransferase [Conservatibacter flavescens]PJG86360.1 hypothetical protein CVP05_00680 [Conservatibacter flavescens]
MYQGLEKHDNLQQASKQANYDITFIVPVYNTVQYLPQCLGSIINQKINKEIIVIDDGSTDNSLAILKDYAAQHDFIRIVTQENKGVSAARNAGLRLAKGAYVYFVDSDDMLIQNVPFATYVSILKNNNLALLKGCAYWERLPYKVLPPVLDKPKQAFYNIYQNKVQRSHHVQFTTSSKYMDALNREHFGVELWTYIFQTDYLRANQIFFDETLAYAEDLLFLVKALSCQDCKMAESSEVFYFYRHRSDSVFHKSSDSRAVLAFIDAKNALLRYILSHDFSPQMRADALLLAMASLKNIAGHYLGLNEQGKQQVNPHITLDLYGMFELFVALTQAKTQTNPPVFEQYRGIFRRLLGDK